MKKIVLVIFLFVVTSNLFGQDTIVTLHLQQVELNDSLLVKTLSTIIDSESYCFNKFDYYVIDFFFSSLSSKEYFANEYYITIRDLFIDKYPPVAYFTIINDITLFLPNRLQPHIYTTLPITKDFTFEITDPFLYSLRGDYEFLIHRTLSGRYVIMLQTCGE